MVDFLLPERPVAATYHSGPMGPYCLVWLADAMHHGEVASFAENFGAIAPAPMGSSAAFGLMVNAVYCAHCVAEQLTEFVPLGELWQAVNEQLGDARSPVIWRIWRGIASRLDDDATPPVDYQI